MLASKPTQPLTNLEIRFPARSLGASPAESVGRGRQELCMFGGNANNGSNCGPFYVNSNNAFSNSNANYGSRLTKSVKNGILVLSPIATERDGLPSHDPTGNPQGLSGSVGVGYSEVRKSRKRKGPNGRGASSASRA